MTWPCSGTGMPSTMPISPRGHRARIPGERMAGATHLDTGESQVWRAKGGMPRLRMRPGMHAQMPAGRWQGQGQEENGRESRERRCGSHCGGGLSMNLWRIWEHSAKGLVFGVIRT